MTAADPIHSTDAAQLAEDATIWERRLKALTLRNAGASYPAIASAMGVTVKVAQSYVRTAMKEVVRLPADQMVERQRAILLDITKANYQPAMSGDQAAQAMLLKVLEHEAKLFGLYAPQRVSVGISESEFAAQAAELLAAVGTEPLRELAGLPQQTSVSVTSESGALLSPQVIDVEAEQIDEEPWSNL